MKTYFENDPDKQEMLEAIVFASKEICNLCRSSGNEFGCGVIIPSCPKYRPLKSLIERITNESIEEVLK